MAKSAYVVMSTFDSPVAFVIPTPVAVFDRRSDATKWAAEKTKRAAKNRYYVRRVQKGAAT